MALNLSIFLMEFVTDDETTWLKLVVIDWHFHYSYWSYWFVPMNCLCRAYELPENRRRDHTENKRIETNRIEMQNKRTLTTRFFKPLLISPFIFESKRLRRREPSTLTCSFLRKARLERRAAFGWKSMIDDRRRNDDRGSGCLKSFFQVLFSVDFNELDVLTDVHC